MRFTKMQGCGNDFILVESNQLQGKSLSIAFVTNIAQRQIGIGFDQLLLLTATDTSDHYHLAIMNADGSYAYQCGNGLRCVALYLDKLHQTQQVTWHIHIGEHCYAVTGLGDGQYQATLGQPYFKPSKIPFLTDIQEDLYSIHTPWGPLQVGIVGVGNPHLVWRINDCPQQQIESQVRFLSGHHQFPQGININTVHIKDDTTLQLHVYERGTGWTQACGSGACASVIVAIKNNWIKARQAKVIQPGGELTVLWPNDHGPVTLIGQASIIFEGTIDFQ